jgi:hypothetical protein
MTDDSNDKLLGGLPFVYPDPLTEVRCIDGAAFLYFSEVAVPLPVQPVSDYSEWGADLWDMVVQRHPSWAHAFLFLWDTWQDEIRGVNSTLQTLSPLKDRIKLVMMVYDADQSALDRSRNLINEAHYTTERVLTEVATLGGAAGELMKHLILEEWLNRDNDLESLYEYCATIFTSDRIPGMLAESYLLRCTPFSFDIKGTILLNNEHLVPFLDHLRAELGPPAQPESVPSDIITWELFRQILTPYLDPITEATAEKIAECLSERHEEIIAFKRQCERLSDKLAEIPDLERMKSEVTRFIDLYVKDEIASLLNIRDATRRDIVERVLADRIAWAGTLGFIYGAVHGDPTISVAGAIGALAFIGSSVSHSIADYKRMMHASSYKLVYRLSH